MSRAAASKRRRIIKRLIIGAFLFFAVCVVLAAGPFRKSILVEMGSMLVYESELAPCDALVVLSGGGTLRLEKAVALYKEGLAPRILLTLPEVIAEDAVYHDLLMREKMMCQAVLDLYEIPQESVFWSDQAHYSTYSEAVFLSQWLKENNLKSAIAVSGYFQSGRARWSMKRAIPERWIKVLIAPASNNMYSATDWWKHEEGLIMVENEFLKNTYYRIKGLFGTP